MAAKETEIIATRNAKTAKKERDETLF